MKKLLICMLIMTVFTGASCASAPAKAPPEAKTEAQPEAQAEARPAANTDDALRQVYTATQPMLDMSNARDYTVKWGDTLSQITRRYYGDLSGVGNAGPRNGFYFPVIIMASPDCNITDPDLIVPGTKLKIIDLKANLANPAARQAIKNGLKEAAGIYKTKHRPREEAGLTRLSESL